VRKRAASHRMQPRLTGRHSATLKSLDSGSPRALKRDRALKREIPVRASPLPSRFGRVDLSFVRACQPCLRPFAPLGTPDESIPAVGLAPAAGSGPADAEVEHAVEHLRHRERI
jgi:hypothetical protein